MGDLSIELWVGTASSDRCHVMYIPGKSIKWCHSDIIVNNSFQPNKVVWVGWVEFVWSGSLIHSFIKWLAKRLHIWLTLIYNIRSKILSIKISPEKHLRLFIIDQCWGIRQTRTQKPLCRNNIKLENQMNTILRRGSLSNRWEDYFQNLGTCFLLLLRYETVWVKPSAFQKIKLLF